MTKQARTGKLYVVWRDPESRAQLKIGEFSYDGFVYQFRYDPELLRVAASHGFSFEQSPLSRAFPDVNKLYDSPEIFSFFAHRLPDERRSDYREALAPSQSVPGTHPFELLRNTRGRLATDQLSLEQAALETEDGMRVECNVAGWRFFEGDAILSELAPGVAVRLEREKSNRYDSNAVMVLSQSGCKLGYVPAFHSELVAEALSTGRGVRAAIVEMKPPPEPSDERAKIRISIVFGNQGGLGRTEIQRLLREKLRRGELPRSIPGPLHPSQLEGYEAIIIGSGFGKVCSVCDQVIGKPEELSTEFRYPSGQRVFFHYQCFELWQEARHQPTPR